MTESEVRCLVRREIDSIKKSESGVLPPTPYVVLEVIRRLKTLKPWEGLGASEPLGEALRLLVEQALGKKPIYPKMTPTRPSTEVEDLRTMAPLEAAKKAGTRKHRHLRAAV